MKKFYPLTAIMTDKLRKANLTAAEWELWSYLVTIAPFGDKYYDLPDTLEIISKLNISKSTFYRAIAKFQKEELFDFQDKGFVFRNLGVESQFSESSRKSKNRVAKVRTPVSNLRQESQICENEPSEPAPQANSKSSQTIQTIQTLSYSSDPHPPTPGEKEREEGENASYENTRADGKGNEKIICEKPKSINSSVTINQNSGIEKSSTPRSTSRTRNITEWLPDGEWKIDGKLDGSFHEWMGKKWLQWYGDRYKGDIHAARADVLAHFQNQPDKLPIRWNQYCEEYLHRYDNTKTLLDNGCKIDEQYQQQLLQNHRAITTPLNEPLTSDAPVPMLKGNTVLPPVSSTDGRTLGEVASPNPASTMSSLPVDEDYGAASNPQAYQQWQSPEPEPEEEKETVNVFKELGAFLKSGLRSMPERQPVPEVDPLKELNEWMHDDILRAEAIRRVKASDRYTFEYDDYGNPYRVIEPEF